MNAAPLQDEAQRAEDIALIKEIAPSYGDGFIGACLAACGGDSQRTTNMLLEGKFPEQLALLDRQTGKTPGLCSCKPCSRVCSSPEHACPGDKFLDFLKRGLGCPSSFLIVLYSLVLYRALYSHVIGSLQVIVLAELLQQLIH